MTIPLFQEMTHEQCEEFLGDAHVGRLAFALHDATDVVPLGFRFENGFIYGRTSPGAKLATLERNRRVAFEVDEFHGPFDWKSVVVLGLFHLIDPDTDTQVKAALQRLFPDAFGTDDPVAFRNRFFGISVEKMTGRIALPGAGQPRAVRPDDHTFPEPDAAADALIRRDVLAALASVTEGQTERVRISVDNAIVMLSGTVGASEDRSKLVRSIAAMTAVKGIVQELEVDTPSKLRLTPFEITARAADAVEKAMSGAKGHVVAVYENAWIRLEGEAPADMREKILASLQHIAGTRGIVDRINEAPAS